MKLSKQTIAILKNFASINSAIIVNKGNILMTKSVNNVVYAEAEIEDEFTTEIPIYDLKEFLSTLELFNDDPTIKVDGTNLLMSSARSNCSYQLADKSLIVTPKSRLKFPAANVSFNLPNSDLEQIIKAGQKMRLPDIKIFSKDGSIFISVMDIKDDSAHDFSTKIGSYEGDHVFEVYLKLDNLKMVPGDYTVQIVYANGNGAVKFVGNVISYVIAMEENTKFN